jgi:hypothetical protein
MQQTPQLTSGRALADARHTHHTAPYSIDIPARPNVAYEAFVEYVWKRGAGNHPCAVTVEGDKYGEGCTRRLPLSTVEIITRVVPYCKIEYTVVSSGLLPVATQRGTIVFDNLGTGSTRVTWCVDFSPLFGVLGAGVVYCMPTLVFAPYLNKLYAHVVGQKQTQLARI